MTPDFLAGLVARLRAEEPGLEAVLLAGSHARGEADAFSDVDLVGLTARPHAEAYPTWFVAGPGGQLVHVSIEIGPLEKAECDGPAPWSLGFPSIDVQSYLWATPRARQMLGPDPSIHAPAGTPELGDFVEQHMKVRRSAGADAGVELRWNARLLGEFAPGLLREFNPERRVTSPLAAIRAAADLPNAPPGYRDDFITCMGLREATDLQVRHAADRLTLGTLAFLRERLQDTTFPPGDIRANLIDGTLERYVNERRDR